MPKICPRVFQSAAPLYRALAGFPCLFGRVRNGARSDMSKLVAGFYNLPSHLATENLKRSNFVSSPIDCQYTCEAWTKRTVMKALHTHCTDNRLTQILKWQKIWASFSTKPLSDLVKEGPVCLRNGDLSRKTRLEFFFFFFFQRTLLQFKKLSSNVFHFRLSKIWLWKRRNLSFICCVLKKSLEWKWFFFHPVRRKMS